MEAETKHYRPPDIALQQGSYRHNSQHLRDELARIDLLVRAFTVRWRLMGELYGRCGVHIRFTGRTICLRDRTAP